MIIYFSATGNCKHVANKIAQSLSDKSRSIEEISPEIQLSEGEVFGIVTPTYWWELPINVREFLQKMKLHLQGEHYIFSVSTYGTTPGASGADVMHILKKKGIELNAMYSVKMTDTWTPFFDLSDKVKVAAENKAADLEIQTVAAQIKERKTGNRMHKSMPYGVRLITDMLYNNERRTKHFHVENSCIGCGLCAKNCPTKAIEMHDKHPVWVKPKCAICLRCLHSCPKFSIQYGRNTKKHGQYRHP